SDLRADKQRLKRDLESAGGSTAFHPSAHKSGLSPGKMAGYGAGILAAAGIIAAAAATLHQPAVVESRPEATERRASAVSTRAEGRAPVAEQPDSGLANPAAATVP